MILSIMATSSSWLIKEKINFRLLNPRFNINDNILWTLFSSYFDNKERKMSMLGDK
jgi:hypothetical protein